MGTCTICNKTILFGGHQAAGHRFCSDACLDEGQVLVTAQAVPADTVRSAALEIHRGLCPACGGSGPVDVHTSHQIWSLILMSSWKSEPRISCRACGFRKQLGGLVFSLIAGWWGFPWGLVMTPVQVGRNVVAMVRPPDTMQPSPALEQHVRLVLAEQALYGDKPEA